jgi:hypothetical protein
MDIRRRTNVSLRGGHELAPPRSGRKRALVHNIVYSESAPTAMLTNLEAVSHPSPKSHNVVYVDIRGQNANHNRHENLCLNLDSDRRAQGVSFRHDLLVRPSALTSSAPFVAL